MLILTNGSTAVDALEHAGIPGEKLAWEDVLHDGPVPAGLDLAELSTVRARFIADWGWGDFEDVAESFRRRDGRVGSAAGEDEVVLWFEHDLYDQLQLLQILDCFVDPRRRPRRLSLVCRPAYVALEAPADLAAAFETREEVTAAQLELARAAWAAFRAPLPNDLCRLLESDTASLPFLAGAFRRLLQEYPWEGDGLARSERQILQAIAEQPGRRRGELFRATQANEDPLFLGDASFFHYLDDLCRGARPLAAETGEGYELTRAGQEVLDGRVDRIRVRGLDLWKGGVRIAGGSVWRWSPSRETVVPD